MHADDIRLLFDYSYAATARILDAAGRLTPEEFVSPAPVRGCASLRNILVHTPDSERGWREGLQTRGADAGTDLEPATFPDVSTLARARRADEERMPPGLAALDDAELNVPAADGCLLWQCLTHVVNHGTQHRSEAAMMLTHWGQSPGELDLMYYPHQWEATPDARIGPPSES
jgi:uncharacterized damage-inducible protein DinB